VLTGAGLDTFSLVVCWIAPNRYSGQRYAISFTSAVSPVGRCYGRLRRVSRVDRNFLSAILTGWLCQARAIPAGRDGFVFFAWNETGG
jgi:hypothetical protein